ncbi:flagellar biosynthesis anti-sigma factor FlgM [Allosphingosinicella flava]|uniref:Negative regulator of flagellin synthesis n=1 Tax=Allosphingosinicella flava TaxID=2771430 RepID=A0A7T2LMP9_9SPHN|nr:flagellar biosynthesis anti-sigma factor FlgM [Sphingosinicella flava]QPQ55342.1 flagellar biosynthesis anti-sigma factor FlgM [Sphingosinicella flava]
MMIDGVGNKGVGQIGLQRGQVSRSQSASNDRSGQGIVAAPGNLLADLAAGPPVNAEKIAALKAAIAEGRYPVDPDKIAERMIALDLPLQAAQ